MGDREYTVGEGDQAHERVTVRSHTGADFEAGRTHWRNERVEEGAPRSDGRDPEEGFGDGGSGRRIAGSGAVEGWREAVYLCSDNVPGTCSWPLCSERSCYNVPGQLCSASLGVKPSCDRTPSALTPQFS